MRLNLPLVAFCWVIAIWGSGLYAQPSNDECINATPIPSVDNWCSAPAAYSSEGATPSGFPPPSCWNNTRNDIWFSFTATATDVVVNVIGNTSGGGTLERPQVALYSGNCTGFINEEECSTNALSNIVELYKGGLAVGETYFIRVQGEFGRTGTFELCVNNFNPPVQPGSDCVSASVLCNKEGFSVDNVVGPGNDPDEANGSSCLGFGTGNSESNSTWFTWTAATTGTLTFTLAPSNPGDDLDFVLYELPDGILNCANKQELRCMASGDFGFPSPCMGPTGLADGETDFSEPAGCMDPSQNNFLAPLQMEAGRSYALLVNNFTSTGNGFSVEFGGTGEFVGPRADFTADEPDFTVCVGEPIRFTDASTFPLGNIVAWRWAFGSGASQAQAFTQGPHTVSYNTAGLKSIVLTVESEQGCLVTEVKTIRVECCTGHFDLSASTTETTCPDGSDGSIDLTVDNPYGPYNFLWPDGQTSEDVSGLGIGTYEVLISDQAGCDTSFQVAVAGPEPFDVDTFTTRATCNGGMDGAIELQVTGGTPGYEFNWQNTGFGPDNTLTGLPIGNYSVTIRDQAGCTLDLVIPVRELTLSLNPEVQSITPPSCFGFSDGIIRVSIANGTPDFRYNFNDGNGFVPDSVLQNLPGGIYNVIVEDANECRGNFTFELRDPDPLANSMLETNVSCFGESDGSAATAVSGGTGGYVYQWANGQSASNLTGLPVGDYPLLVLDANGCELRDTARILQPPPLYAGVLGVRDARCFGDANGEIQAEGLGGVPPYAFSVDNVNYQQDPQLTGLPAGTYTLYVQDANGCIGDTLVALAEPPPLRVEAGADQQVELGFSTDLLAIATYDTLEYLWSPADSLSCVACPDPIADPSRTTRYTVTVRDELGCTASDSLTVFVLINRPVYIPNAFSPNGDGRNDFFTVYGGAAADGIESLRVYSRWGELLYEGRDLPLGSESDGWDGTFRGKALNNGVYVYVAEVRFRDQVVQVFEGDVTLLR